MKLIPVIVFLSASALYASPQTMQELMAYQQSQQELLYIETAVDQAAQGHLAAISPFPVAKSIMQGALTGFGVISACYAPLKQVIS